jgi:UDP-glucose 4-epimerase
MKSRPSPFRHVRVLVLGASGFIGYWVARALRDHGAHLMCAVRGSEGAERLSREQLGAVVVRRDLDNLAALRDWLPALRPSVVFNLAGYGVDRGERDEARAQRLNVDLVEVLAEVMGSLPSDEWERVRLVHVGSALEYGTTGGTLREDDPCSPTTAYGRSKLAGTQALQRVAAASGLASCVARLFTVYGPGEHEGRLLPSLLAAAESGAEVPLSAGTQRRDFTYVEEVAEGLVRLAVADMDPGEVVNLATGTMHSVREFALLAAGVLRVPTSRLAFGAVPTRAEEMVNDGVSISRLLARTGWSPDDDLVAGVVRTIARRAERR